MNNRKNPWLGLKSYEEYDRLYGRNKETTELSNIILNSFHTIIYGKSGIGKTSLLKAGVFPVLRYEDFYPVYIRLEHDSVQNTGYEYYLTQIENLLKKEDSGFVIQHDEEKEITSLSELFDSYQFSTSKGIELTPIFVLDQFEEIFTLNEYNNTLVSRFFRDLSDIFNSDTSVRNYRLVFCLREDYLYYIERFSETTTALKRNRYSLQNLSRDEALEIITKPQKNLVDKVVANEILHKLASNATGEINATILSLYLSQLYEKMVEIGADSISYDIIHQFGDDIISSFYNNSIKCISNKSTDYLEEHLVTVGGYRHNIPLEDALSAGVTPKEIDNLKKKRIINVQPNHFAVDYIEFSHDVLCPVVIKHRDERVIKNRAKRILKLCVVVLAIIGIIFTFFVRNQIQEEKVKAERLSFQVRDQIQKDKIKAKQIENDSIKKLNGKLQASAEKQDSQLVEINAKNIELKKQNEEITQLNNKIVQRGSVSGVMSICKNIREAVENNNMHELYLLNQVLESFKTGIGSLSVFKSKSDETGDWSNGLNNHFVFEPLFIQKYIHNKNVLLEAQDYFNQSIKTRRSLGANYVLMKTCIIKKNAQATWRYRVRGHNELAIVTEPHGLLTMQVHDISNQKIYTNNSYINTGLPSLYIPFDTPKGKPSIVDVTITNTTNHDVSFVVISN